MLFKKQQKFYTPLKKKLKIKKKLRKPLSSFYVVGLTSDLKVGKKNYFTLVSTFEQAEEYILNKAVVDQIGHFEEWCRIHNIPKEEQNKIDLLKKYFLTCVNDKSKYSIGIVDITRENLASIIRLCYNCMPLGCSFDTDMEKVNLLNNIRLYQTSQKIKEELDKVKVKAEVKQNEKTK